MSLPSPDCTSRADKPSDRFWTEIGAAKTTIYLTQIKTSVLKSSDIKGIIMIPKTIAPASETEQDRAAIVSMKRGRRGANLPVSSAWIFTPLPESRTAKVS